LINASGRDIRLQVDGGVTAANIKEIAEVSPTAANVHVNVTVKSLL
jgi:pentose-5-phosphate-3-epimerase